MQIKLPNLTHKCSIMNRGNSFKVKWCQGHESQKLPAWVLHSCECWLLLVYAVITGCVHEVTHSISATNCSGWRLSITRTSCKVSIQALFSFSFDILVTVGYGFKEHLAVVLPDCLHGLLPAPFLVCYSGFWFHFFLIFRFWAVR